MHYVPSVFPALRLALFGTVLSLLFLEAAAAACFKPILHRNQMPPAAILLELPPDSACALEGGVPEVRLGWQGSNTTVLFKNKGEYSARYLIDHERWEQTVQVRLGLGAGFDLGVLGRYTNESAGRWDPFMRDFHEITGLPYNSRKIRPDGEYRYWQCNPSDPSVGCTAEDGAIGRVFDLSAEQRGWADWITTLRYALPHQNSGMRWAGRLVWKEPSRKDLPTISSGARDFGAGLMLEGAGTFWDCPTDWLVNLGGVAPGTTRHRAYPQNKLFLNGTLGLSHSCEDDWAWLGQFQFASARYRTPNPPVQAIGTPQFIMMLGFEYRTAPGSWRFGITEDTIYNTSEDFSLLLEWLWEPSGPTSAGAESSRR